MGIDTLSNEKSHVQDLGLEKTKDEYAGLLFDPEKDITESDMENVEKWFNAYNDSNNNFYETTFNLLTFMKIFNPERFSKLHINPIIQEKELHHFETFKKQPLDYYHIIKFASEIKLGAPELFNKTNIKEEDYEVLKNNYDKNYKPFFHDSLTYAFNLLVLFPQKQQEISNLSDQQWADLESTIHGHLKDEHGYVWRAAICKVLYPQRFKEIHFSKDELRKMKDALDGYRQDGDWGNFIDQAAFLKILTAKEVNVTDNGIELIIPEKDLKKPENLPMERNY